MVYQGGIMLQRYISVTTGPGSALCFLNCFVVVQSMLDKNKEGIGAMYS